MKQLEKNVSDFLEQAAAQVGKMHQQNFSTMAWIYLADSDITSPIEKIFYLAVIAYAELYNLEHKDHREEDNKTHPYLFLNSQKQIGKFRVDFLLEYFDFKDELHRVVIELDGHDFHDKDKHQRAYEKSRDRYLTLSGLTVLHFTGSELVKDPYKAVLEAFIALDIASKSLLESYDPNNPFGLE